MYASMPNTGARQEPAKAVEVAVAVILRGCEVLLALRPKHKKHAGLWEFPGGKFESGESLQQALRREILEELDIEVTDYTDLMDIEHQYEDYSVCLRVALVTGFVGKAKGNEKQQIAWVPIKELESYRFPEANTAILGKLAEMKL